MIAHVKTHPDEPPRGYIALHQTDDGEWIPITRTIYETADAAVRACTASAAQILENAAECVERGQADLARLTDAPRPSDRVRVAGQLCPIDSDGTLTLPPEHTATVAPRPHHDYTIDQPLYDALVEAMNLSNLTLSAATGLLVDALLNTPTELLIAVHDTQGPEMLGPVAKLLVDVSRHARDDSYEPRPWG